MKNLSKNIIHDVTQLSDLKSVATEISSLIKAGDIIYLKGDLGTGKTTLVQLILKILGHKKPVKSPTYTIYEHYRVSEKTYYHMDLYRLSEPEELYYLGIDTIFNDINIVFIEWPEKGKNVLPLPTLTFDFQLDTDKRTLIIT